MQEERRVTVQHLYSFFGYARQWYLSSEKVKPEECGTFHASPFFFRPRRSRKTWFPATISTYLNRKMGSLKSSFPLLVVKFSRFDEGLPEKAVLP